MRFSDLQIDALYPLVERIVERIKEKGLDQQDSKLIADNKAMSMFGINSQTTFDVLQTQGKIMDEPTPKYIKGFNNGYLIQKYRPNVELNFTEMPKSNVDYYQGLKDGGEQYHRYGASLK